MPTSYFITLTWYEIQMAAGVGLARACDSLRRGKRTALFSGDDEEENDMHAACAEKALAILLNQDFIGGIDAAKDPDVGTGYEVKFTSKNKNLLIRKKNFHPDRTYVLVVGRIPTFEIVGWIRGSDAMRDCWKCNPKNKGECYIVPRRCLKEFLDVKERMVTYGADADAARDCAGA